jgi:Tol biopolymer transport system component
VIFFILLALVGVHGMGSQINVEVHLAGKLPPETVEVGPNGPLKFEFSRAIQAELVPSLVSFVPPLPGKIIWDDFTHMRFIPDQPISPDIIYTVTVNKGVIGRSGEKIQNSVAWKFKLREPMVVFLSDQQGVMNLWTKELSGNSSPKQITQAQDAIWDYAPSPNGEQIVYAMLNTKGGVDLWTIDRDGQQNHILLDCGLDRCSTISWNKDSQKIVYNRQSAGVSPDAPLGAPRPWLMDTRTGETAPLYDDPQVIGYSPSWSPDGQKIASFDGVNGVIQILDLKSKKSTNIPSNFGLVGTWSIDSQSMYFTDIIESDSGNKVQGFKADVNSGQSQAIFTSKGLASNINFDNPLESPKGDVLAVGTQIDANNPGDQIWLISENDEHIQTVTNDPSYSYDEYSWNPSGDKLLFRGLKLGSAENKTTTFVWDLQTQQITLVAANSSNPFWLP